MLEGTAALAPLGPERFLTPADMPTNGEIHRAIRGGDFDAAAYDAERAERYAVPRRLLLRPHRARRTFGPVARDRVPRWGTRWASGPPREGRQLLASDFGQMR